MKGVLLAVSWVLLAAAVPAPATATEPGARAAAELRLHGLTAAGNEAGLGALAADAAAPPVVRGRALFALFSRRPLPLSQADRLRLLRTLGDASPELRGAALRCVGQARERTLESEALRLAAEDPDPQVRVEALRAVRGWTRQGHLYFLQQALGASSTAVQAEALKSLARLEFRDVPPDIVAYVQGCTGPNQPVEVRLRALEALKAWRKLDWAEVRDVLFEAEDSESLRLFAVAASDGVGPVDERNRILVDILSSDPSQRLAWEAFQRLRRAGGDESNLLKGVARFLAFSGRRNAATEEMAAYLRSRGLRADYRSGAWKITRP
ncbi:MAG: HEAT repeat domain-containing protein [Deltaproteobacteria bacterium]|nr:HEAT repeat domain-containing protein [Deltaproteobacteria bacterium]